MQIQKIGNFNNKYTSNKTSHKGQQSSPNNPNFGMRLVYNDAIIAKFAGIENVVEVKAALEEFGREDSLISRFKAVFQRNKNLFAGGTEHFDPRVMEKWDDTVIAPVYKYGSLPDSLDVTELEDDTLLGHVVTEIIDSNDSLVRSGTTYIPNSELADAMIEATDHALDNYAIARIADSLGVPSMGKNFVELGKK